MYPRTRKPTKCDLFELAPLPKAVPASCTSWTNITGRKADMIIIDDVIKEEGKTPMRYNDNYASASVHTVTPQSDTAVQRDYLLTRLAHADSPKETELYKLFNMDADNAPKTFKELIDAIKNDKFSVNKKIENRLNAIEKDDLWFYGPLYGIVWDGKQPDPDGYNNALGHKNQQYRFTKDIIMGGVYTDGLKALQDFEAWLPTPAVTTTVQ